MKIKLTAFLFSVLLLSGCIIYKQDIQQGNEITAEMISKLEIGMTQREVTRVLGFPLINDPFHKDRWDYYYSKKEGKTGKVTRQSATLFFKDQKLSELETSLAE